MRKSRPTDGQVRGIVREVGTGGQVLEDEDRRLERLVAGRSLDDALFQDVVGRKGCRPRSGGASSLRRHLPARAPPRREHAPPRSRV